MVCEIVTLPFEQYLKSVVFFALHLHRDHSHSMTSSACPHGWPLSPYLAEKNLHDPRSFYISRAAPGLSYHRPSPCRGSGLCCPRHPPRAALPPPPPDSFLKYQYLSVISFNNFSKISPLFSLTKDDLKGDQESEFGL